MNKLRHVNRQHLCELIRKHLIEVDYEQGREESAYGEVVNAKVLRTRYPSKNCGEIYGKKFSAVR